MIKMLLSKEELEVYNFLKNKDIIEQFPYIENGFTAYVDTIEEIYFKAVFSYNTFEPIITTNQYYSAKEIKNIKLIMKYQEQMEAYYKPFQFDRKVQDTNTLTHTQVKEKLTKQNKKSKGIYWVTGLNGYCSTTLYENPCIEQGEGREGHLGCGMYKKIRLYGKMAVVLPMTLLFYEGTKTDFIYPYKLKGVSNTTLSIYDIYFLAYKYGNDLVLEQDRYCYSSQQKSIVRKLKRLKGYDR